MKIKCVLKVRRPPENGPCEENDKAAHGGILKVGDLKLTRPADFKVKAGKDPTDKKCNLKPPTNHQFTWIPPSSQFCPREVAAWTSLFANLSTGCSQSDQNHPKKGKRVQNKKVSLSKHSPTPSKQNLFLVRKFEKKNNNKWNTRSWTHPPTLAI